MNSPKPVRLQRRRTKGFHLVSPNGLPNKCVTRPGPFGNIFRANDFGGAENAVRLFEMMLVDDPWVLEAEIYRLGHGTSKDLRLFRLWCVARIAKDEILSRIHELRGHNLVCYCGDKPCHADVLLRIANG
jgi:hypothetical protein